MLLLLFIVIPLLEIYLFIQVGSAIGAFTTIVLILLTAVTGIVMLKAQSLSTMSRFGQAMQRGDGSIGFELLEGMLLIIGGFLLITPGFFTDTLGLICLIRRSRLWLIHLIVKHTLFGISPQPDNFIEGQFKRYDDD